MASSPVSFLPIFMPATALSLPVKLLPTPMPLFFKWFLPNLSSLMLPNLLLWASLESYSEGCDTDLQNQPNLPLFHRGGWWGGGWAVWPWVRLRDVWQEEEALYPREAWRWVFGPCATRPLSTYRVFDWHIQWSVVPCSIASPPSHSANGRYPPISNDTALL